MRKSVARASNSNTPRSTKLMRGQLAANGRPMSSGTVRNLAKSATGLASAASSESGSIQQAEANVTTISPVAPPRFQGWIRFATRSGSELPSSIPAMTSNGICASICAVMLASSIRCNGGAASSRGSKPPARRVCARLIRLSLQFPEDLARGVLRIAPAQYLDQALARIDHQNGGIVCVAAVIVGNYRDPEGALQPHEIRCVDRPCDLPTGAAAAKTRQISRELGRRIASGIEADAQQPQPVCGDRPCEHRLEPGEV